MTQCSVELRGFDLGVYLRLAPLLAPSHWQKMETRPQCAQRPTTIRSRANELRAALVEKGLIKAGPQHSPAVHCSRVPCSARYLKFSETRPRKGSSLS